MQNEMNKLLKRCRTSFNLKSNQFSVNFKGFLINCFISSTFGLNKIKQISKHKLNINVDQNREARQSLWSVRFTVKNKNTLLLVSFSYSDVREFLCSGHVTASLQNRN